MDNEHTDDLDELDITKQGMMGQSPVENENEGTDDDQDDDGDSEQ